MGRKNNSGGGQSSLGYLFGSSELPKPAGSNDRQTVNDKPPVADSKRVADVTNMISAGINDHSKNNYLRANGQNTGNFITDRPSTKVHAAPGGASSLGYLFGGGSN